ncbi:uncharacterized protein [Clytia hemisphaerica]|uniref:Uncharacterized protein n=1 Tax=Clytia hemisphaerica TaxID=252671 RepID=A0A7M5VDS1_9CNID
MDLKILILAFLAVVIIEKCNSCKIPVLSSDHKGGKSIIGKYFNIDRKRIRGLRYRGVKRFMAYNFRLGLLDEVIVWGNKKGGSIGNAHGRFSNRGNVTARPGQWQPGDYLVPMDCSICANLQNSSCSIDVLGTVHGHASYRYGQYFNFNRAQVNGLGKNGGMQFLAYNPRNSLMGYVHVWGRASGGGIGDAHGRFNGHGGISYARGQWQVGDKVIPIDQSYCVRSCPL